MKIVCFKGTCGASASKVLVSKRIGHPFTLKEISCRFAQGCDNLLAIRFYTSNDSSDPATGEPSGISMLQDYGQVDYVVGNDDTKILKHDLDVDESGTYIKVYAVNSDTFDHSIDCQIAIEDRERK